MSEVSQFVRRWFDTSNKQGLLALVLVALCGRSVSALPPSTDSCTSPFNLGSGPASDGIFNTTATTGAEGQSNGNCPSPDGSPAFGSPAIEKDVWFTWTANCNGHVEISTCGQTATDTKIALYGPSLSCPSEPAIACNDDACTGIQSFLSHDVHCCDQFLIQIGNKPGAASADGMFSVTCVQDSGQAMCEPLVACCLPTGVCVDVQPDCCLGFGGQPSTYSSTCLGDGSNHDGRDDACVCNFVQAGAPCTACPGEICRPTQVRLTDVDGFNYVEECACASTTNCFVEWPAVHPGCVGTCDQAEYNCRATSELLFGGFEILMSCACAPPCASATDCDDGNTCTCDRCITPGDYCWHGQRKYGDANHNGVVNLDDVLCVLAGFGNLLACTNGNFAPCNDDGVINLDDILAALAAFSGANPCGCMGFNEPYCWAP